MTQVLLSSRQQQQQQQQQQRDCQQHTCSLAMSPPPPQSLLHSSRVRASRSPGASIAAAFRSLHQHVLLTFFNQRKRQQNVLAFARILLGLKGRLEQKNNHRNYRGGIGRRHIQYHFTLSVASGNVLTVADESLRTTPERQQTKKLSVCGRLELFFGSLAVFHACSPIKRREQGDRR